MVGTPSMTLVTAHSDLKSNNRSASPFARYTGFIEDRNDVGCGMLISNEDITAPSEVHASPLKSVTGGGRAQ